MKKNIKSVSEIYICPKKAGNKFRSARKFHTPLYLYGVTGIGKTALILNNVNMKKCSYYSATTILADEINIEKKTTEHTVVIDDLQSLADSSQKEAYFEKIKELLGRRYMADPDFTVSVPTLAAATSCKIYLCRNRRRRFSFFS